MVEGSGFLWLTLAGFGFSIVAEYQRDTRSITRKGKKVTALTSSCVFRQKLIGHYTAMKGEIMNNSEWVWDAEISTGE